MIIIAGYIRTDVKKRDVAVVAYRDLVERARAYGRLAKDCEGTACEAPGGRGQPLSH